MRQGFSPYPLRAQGSTPLSDSCLGSRPCQQPASPGGEASCQAASAGKGNIIHQGDKAADEKTGLQAAVPQQELERMPEMHEGEGTEKPTVR